MRATAVGCYECHGLNPGQHQDNFEHFGFRINVVVSPNDCRVCHEEEALMEKAVGQKAAKGE